MRTGHEFEPRDTGETLPTDRRTRDRVRLFFWAVLTIVCLSAVLVSHQQQTQGLRLKAEGAQERAIRYTENVLDGRLDAHRVASPIERSGYDQLLAQLKRDLFTDQRIVRVRVWRPDGLLVFTTDDPSKIGALTSKDPSVRAALQGDVVSVIQTETVAPDTSTTPVPTELFSTYVPLRDTDKAAVHGVVEIDSDYGLMRDSTSRPWKQMQVAFGIVALLCLVMTIVSFVWSRRPEEVSGFGPNRRDVRASARDDKKAASAQAEASKLRERVKELEHQAEQVKAEQAKKDAAQKAAQKAQPAPPNVETPDPAETERLTARAKQLEAQAQSVEARSLQLQARVTEMEAQLRVTTEQLRSAQKRQEAADAASAERSSIPPEVQAQLQVAGETEQVLRAELQAAQAEVEGLQKARDEIEQAHTEQAKAQQSQLDQTRAQARMAEEERQRSLAEQAKSATVQPAIAPDVAARIEELEQQLKRSEHERAMLRAGRPETVYEARNRELEDELAHVGDQLRVAEGRARSSDAATAGVDPSVIAALEDRITAAEERARDAERRLDEAKPRSGSRSRTPKGNGNGEAAPIEDDAEKPVKDDAEQRAIDGSDLRSRLVRSTDAKRRGATPVPEDARSSRAGRPRK
ncbi:MAG: hypothetical protein ACRDH7_01125 [Actinomycetota bacterium]